MMKINTIEIKTPITRINFNGSNKSLKENYWKNVIVNATGRVLTFKGRSGDSFEKSSDSFNVIPYANVLAFKGNSGDKFQKSFNSVEEILSNPINSINNNDFDYDIYDSIYKY